MIAWMSDWLKQIIIVIMLAAFVDLLLPNNGLQRYVRTVLGLFILLTLLTPLFSLFQKSFDPGKLTASVEQLPSLMGIASKESVGAAKMKPLESVLQEGNQIRTVNEQQTVQLLEARLSSELKSSIETINGVSVKNVSVEIQSDNNGKPYIHKMQAILYNIDGAINVSKDQPLKKEEESKSSMQPVNPVKPVQIQVLVGDVQAGAKSAQETAERLKQSEQEAKTRIYELLTQQWQLKRDQAQLYYESEQRKVR
ncbi:MAG: spoIIIAF [Paenibacillus sp.]|jgi:stage III sporulation protein AF|nr:spoIIIAF [Paenibacillus sp.]